MRTRHKLLWVASTANTKTGPVPTAYIGTTIDEVRDSCEGCGLLGRGCYAWAGFVRVAMRRHEEGYAKDPERYKLENILNKIDKRARFARIGAMGDPAHADRENLRRDIATLERIGLACITYTHFWREDYASDLRDIAMASCDNRDEAEEAFAMGWKPAVVLPYDYDIHNGKKFKLRDGTEDGALGVVCPAQVKDGVTCNTCRLCKADHQAWSAGKLKAIGFIDHSRTGLAKRRRQIRERGQLPMFNPSHDPYEANTCALPECRGKIDQPKIGRPRKYCSDTCKKRYQYLTKTKPARQAARREM